MREKIIAACSDRILWQDGLMLAGALVGSLLWRLLYTKANRSLLRKRHHLFQALLRATYLPVLSLGWLLVLGYFYHCYVVVIFELCPPLPKPALAYEMIFLLFGMLILSRFLSNVRAYFDRHAQDNKVLHHPMVVFMGWLFNTTLATFFVICVLHVLDIYPSDIFYKLIQCIVAWLIAIIVAYSIHGSVMIYTRYAAKSSNFMAYIVGKVCCYPAVFWALGAALIYSLETWDATFLIFSLSYKQLAVVMLFFMLYHAITLTEEQLLLGRLTQSYPDKTMVQASSKVARVLLVIFSGLVFLTLRGGSIASISNFLGGSAIGVGFAAKEIISNYLSGFIIYLENKFKVGDWIYSADKKIEGTIEYIGMRTTDIRTFDKRLLTVPNGFFSSASIINASRMTNRRVLQTIGIQRTRSEVIDKITQAIRVMLQNHPGIDQSQTLMVHFVSFATSSLDINIYAFTKTKDWKTYRNVQQDVFLKSMQLIEQYGGALAFPTRVLQVPREEKGRDQARR